MTLDSAPSFITLTQGADPVLDPFPISYDQTNAVESDIGSHTISFTVKITEYEALTASYQNSFTFEILCPQVVSLTEGTWVESTTIFDLLSESSKSIAFPTIVSLNVP